MRAMMRLATFALSTVVPLIAASITTSISTLGTNGSGDTVYHYVYTLVDVQLQLNQELEIRFDAAQFRELSHGLAPDMFDLLLFQPNNPLGAPGRFSAVANAGNLSGGVFSVDASFFGAGSPYVQEFFVNQLDAQGIFLLGTVTSGLTAIPEPGTRWLGISGMLAAGIMKAMGRLRR